MILGVTCLRNEGPYVVDWIAHHLAAGFDHMLVLTHDCDDGSAELLNALGVDDRITHLPFEFNADKTVQWQALNIAKKHPLVKDADWVMFFDCDEYMALPEGIDGLPALIDTMPYAHQTAPRSSAISPCPARPIDQAVSARSTHTKLPPDPFCCADDAHPSGETHLA